MLSITFRKNDFRTFIIEQCCTESGVPNNCLGLCVEEQDADPERRSTFLSVCDKFQDIVQRCTIGPKGKFRIQQNEISLLATIVSYSNNV